MRMEGRDEMSARFNFVKIFVKDLDAMSSFYERAFGFEAHVTFENDEFRETLLKQDQETFLLGLLQWKGKAPAGSATVGTIGFVTDDIEKILAAAVGASARSRGEIMDLPGSKVAFLDDPEGNEVELVQFI
jgi:lactoylglutathione lyase